MASSWFDVLFDSFNPYAFLQWLQEKGMYDYLFPFLLIFVLFHVSLSFSSLFKSKKTKEPLNAVITVIAIIVAFFSVSFELSPGYTLANTLMMLFPNISALSVLALMFYLIGAMLGKNYFRGLFSREITSYLFFLIGGLGLTSVLFYLGIAFGFWTYDLGNPGSYWNFFFVLLFLILGVVFIFVGFELRPFGIMFVLIALLYIINDGEGGVFSYVTDPIVFIVFLFTILVSWMGSDPEQEKRILAEKLRRSHKTIQNDYTDTKEYESRIYDVVDPLYKSNLKKWKEKYGDEDWK